MTRTTGTVYKVWIEIEAYDIAAGEGELITPMDLACTGTFATVDEALALAESMNTLFGAEPGQVTHE